jgi:hypothetical protein
VKKKQTDPPLAIIRVVTLDLLWNQEKYDTILELARRNGVELAEMVDTILDDWAAIANAEIGNTGFERRLVRPTTPKEKLH